MIAACDDSEFIVESEDTASTDVAGAEVLAGTDVKAGADTELVGRDIGAGGDTVSPTSDVGASDSSTVIDTDPTARTGLEGHCDRYRECGGTYYESAAACIEATIDYWTECRRPELDAFGDCMNELACEVWGDPDGFNPADTPCNEEWEAITDANCG